MPSAERPKASIRLEELNESTINFSKLPGMTKRCSLCSAYLWPSERTTEPCCYKGKVQLPDTEWSAIVTKDTVLLADIKLWWKFIAIRISVTAHGNTTLPLLLHLLVAMKSDFNRADHQFIHYFQTPTEIIPSHKYT